MTHVFINAYRAWRALLKERSFRISLLVGIAVFFMALIINYQASLYTSQVPVLSVGDLILDNIPPLYDLAFMYIFGIYITALVVTIYPVLFKPELLPFSMKTVAAFLIIRAFFISLTHLGAPEGFFHLPQLADQPGIFRFFYTNDLFFSGHTGFPFLGALLFWQNPVVRFFLLAMSVAQAITVLFLHVHYSIDVFSAYFITYTIYVVSDRIFNTLNHSFRRIVERIRRRMVERLARKHLNAGQ